MTSSDKRLERILLAAILVVAAFFRFYPFGTVSLSNDELSALIRTRFPSYGAMIEHGVLTDFHPAGVQSFLYCWTSLFGEGAFLFRLPFILCGLGSIVLIYLLGRRWFHPAAGLLAAAMFGVLEFTIIYSQLARPYAPGLFCCLIATWFWTDLTEADGSRWIGAMTWLGWVLSMAICMHLHYFTLVYCGALGIWGLIYLKGRTLRNYLFSGLVILLLALPEWIIIREQLKVGDLGGWLGKPEKTWLLSFLYNSFNASWLLIDALIVCFFTGWYVQRARPEWNRYHVLTLYLFMVSFLLAFGYSLLRHPIIQYSTLFFVFPLLLLFFFSFTPAIFRKGVGQVIVVFLVLAGGALSTAAEKRFFRMPAYGVFRELTERAHAWSSDAPAPVISIFNVINPDYLDYYFKEQGWRPAEVIYRPEQARDLSRLMTRLDSLKPASVIYGWTNSYHPEELYFILRERWSLMDQDEAFFNARVSRFTRGSASWPASDARSMVWDYENDSAATALPDSIGKSGKAERMNRGVEFSHTLNCVLDSLRPSAYNVLHARCRFITGPGLHDAQLVLSVEKNKQNLAYFSATLSDWNVKPGQWQEAVVSGVVPEGCSGGTVKVYVWNKAMNDWWIDDLALVLTPAPDPYKKH